MSTSPFLYSQHCFPSLLDSQYHAYCTEHVHNTVCTWSKTNNSIKSLNTKPSIRGTCDIHTKEMYPKFCQCFDTWTSRRYIVQTTTCKYYIPSEVEVTSEPSVMSTELCTARRETVIDVKTNTQPCSHSSLQSCTQQINFTSILYFKEQTLLDPTWTSGIWNENSVNMGQSFHCIQLVYMLKYHAIQTSISGAVSHSIFNFLVFQLPLMTNPTALVHNNIKRMVHSKHLG